ncbi:MAG: TPM domain-containing protein [Clostridia bacterium]
MQILTYVCPTCGATLTHNPANQELSCKYCNFSCPIVAYEERYAKLSNPSSDTSKEQGHGDTLANYTCSRCGGKIVASPTTAAAFCIYCGEKTIFPSKLEGDFRPKAVIGFHKTKEDAEKAFLALCKGRPLLPKEFTRRQNIDKISGVYIPFYLHDYRAEGSLAGQAIKLRSWSDGSYNYEERSYYRVGRSGTMRFEKLPADASKEIDDATMDSLEPFDYAQLTEFNFAYLSGYLAQQPDEEKEKLVQRTKERAEKSLYDALYQSLSSRGYTSISLQEQQLEVTNEAASLALLPVWFLNTRYEKKTYAFAMNGQTGKFVGETPIDKQKSILYFFLIFLLLVGIFLGVTTIWSNANNGYKTLAEVQAAPEAVKWKQLDTKVKVYDYADLWTTVEENQLQQLATEFVNNEQMDIVVTSTNDSKNLSAQAYANDFYDYSGFGIGKYRAGLVLSVNMDLREVYISTCGSAIPIYPDEKIQQMLDSITPALTSENYATAASNFIQQASLIAANYQNYSFYLINFLVPFVLALLILGIMIAMSKRKVKIAETADYFVAGGLNLKLEEDLFLHKNTVSFKIPTNSGGSSGSIGSSGSSHGGGGSSF